MCELYFRFARSIPSNNITSTSEIAKRAMETIEGKPVKFLVRTITKHFDVSWISVTQSSNWNHKKIIMEP